MELLVIFISDFICQLGTVNALAGNQIQNSEI